MDSDSSPVQYSFQTKSTVTGLGGKSLGTLKDLLRSACYTDSSGTFKLC